MKTSYCCIRVKQSLFHLQCIAPVRVSDHLPSGIMMKTQSFVASGYSDGSVMKNPKEYGFTASIVKPFKLTELMQMLEKYMKQEYRDER